MRELQIIGYIGKDAEYQTGRGSEFITFSVATDNGKNKDGTDRPTTWVNCTMPDNEYTAKLFPWLKKGTQVFIRGAASSRAWINKEGKPDSSLNINVDKVKFVGSSKNNNQSTQPESTNQQQDTAFNAPGPALQADDVPF